MLARESISEARFEAGIQFARLFAVARFEPLDAAGLLRPPGGGWTDPTDAMIGAREQEWAKLVRLASKPPGSS